MAENEKIERREKSYRIDIGAYGSIGIEAPTKTLNNTRHTTTYEPKTHVSTSSNHEIKR